MTVTLLVVVNGSNVDPTLFADLVGTSDVRTIRLTSGSHALAQRFGRELVETPYFAFLDDDDEFLDGTLAHRVALLERDPDAALAVVNGFDYDGSGERLRYAEFARFSDDPALSVLASNWLASCGGLFRTGAVAPEVFEVPEAHYMEWTLIAYRLALSTKVAFSPTPGFRVHDSPGSLSKSIEYQLGAARTLDRMLALPAPKACKDRLREKRAAMMHALAEAHLRRGDRRSGFRFHIRSLGERTGMRYLAFTRYLLLPNHCISSKRPLTTE